MERAIFFDKDGTLVENVPFNVDPQKVTFTQGTNKAFPFSLVLIQNFSIT